jgi:hypothetical protein
VALSNARAAEFAEEAKVVAQKVALAQARAAEFAEEAKEIPAVGQDTQLVRANSDLVRAQAAYDVRQVIETPRSTVLGKRVALTSTQPSKKAKVDKTATAAPISLEMHRRLVWFKGVFERHVEMERLLPEDASSQDIGAAYSIFMEEEELKLQDDVLAQEDEEAREAAYAQDAALAVDLATEACGLYESS